MTIGRKQINFIALLLLLCSSFSIISCGNRNSSTDNSGNEEVESTVLKGCGFNSFVEIEKNFSPAEDRVLDIVNSIVSFAGLPSNFSVYRLDNMDNAFASFDGKNRYIVYDSKLFKDVELYSQTYWSSIFILAHEIGHHLSGHTLDGIGSIPSRELEADKFAGHIIHKMGGSLESALLAAELLASEYDSETHPSKVKRIKAITDGWNEAYKQRYSAAIPPNPSDGYCDDIIYGQQDLLSQHYFVDENNNFLQELPDFASALDYSYGVITKVSEDYSFFEMKIYNSSTNSFYDEDMHVRLEAFEYGYDGDLCNACRGNFLMLITPGRRIKVKLYEGSPGGGTAYIGTWTAVQLQELCNPSF